MTRLPTWALLQFNHDLSTARRHLGFSSEALCLNACECSTDSTFVCVSKTFTHIPLFRLGRDGNLQKSGEFLQRIFFKTLFF